MPHSYIVDPVVVDELMPIARYSGVPELQVPDQAGRKITDGTEMNHMEKAQETGNTEELTGRQTILVTGATGSRGTLHLNEDIVYIQREYLEGRRFVPIVTDFERKAQPMIRYRLNDILVERKQPCSCNSPCLALEKIEGREDDMFSFLDEQGRERLIFPDFIRRCILFAGVGQEKREVPVQPGQEGTRKAATGQPGQKGTRKAATEQPGQKGTRKAATGQPGQDMDRRETADPSEFGLAKGERGIRRQTGSSGESPTDRKRKESTWEYRVVQNPDRSITVYADLTEEERENVVGEFRKLARDRRLVLPDIAFAPYDWEVGKKLKRIQRIR